MQVLAPAKINLHLRVGKRRDDGFHPLQSWMCTVALFDKLIFTRARPAQHPATRFSCDRPGIPTDHGNLVLKAMTALAATTDHAEQVAAGHPLSIHLEKRIPHGAGLGGGSSDAARTLLALNRLWELGLGKDQLRTVAASLGSDVPFFLDQPSAICSGRGEFVEPLAAPRVKWAVLVMPEIHMPTPAVYRRFDELGLGTELQAGQEAWTGLGSEDLLEQLTNDLEAPAFSIEPKLKELQEEISHKTDRIVRMSGSGSALFTLLDDEKEAISAAKRIADDLRVSAIPVELAPVIRDDLHEDPATR